MTYLPPVDHPDWHQHAPCHGLTALFFADDFDSITQARAICQQCPYTERCLAENINEEHGVFGGMAPRQRWKIRRGLPPEYRQPGRPPLGHGTRANFLRGCRCDPCREAHRKYDREYKQARRRERRAG